MASFRREEVDSEAGKKLYVAVSKELKACKSLLIWALQNSGGKRVCLIYVHQPAQTISILGGRFPISSLSEQEVRTHREKERQDMSKILDEYLNFCAKAGVQAEKLHIEIDSIEKGIVELISQNEIETLVMGAAADNRYSRKMMEPKSKKANYVRQHAPMFCHIWFICKGRLIYTREGCKQSRPSNTDRSELADTKSRWTLSTSEWSTLPSRANSDDDFDQSSMFSLSQLSGFSQFSESATDSISAANLRTDEREHSLRSFRLPPKPPEKALAANAAEGSMNDMLYDQLDQAIAEAETAKREAFEESMKRRKAEKDAIEAICKAKTAESLCYEETVRRKEIEEELAKAREELESTKSQRDKALQDLRLALDQKLSLERRVEQSDALGTELKGKIISALELLQNYTKL